MARSVAAYRRDKLRLLTLPGVRRCVLNATAPEVMAAPRATDDVLTFGDRPRLARDRGGLRRVAAIVVRELPLIGRHNALNVCGALTALDAVGLSLRRSQPPRWRTSSASTTGSRSSTRPAA